MLLVYLLFCIKTLNKRNDINVTSKDHSCVSSDTKYILLFIHHCKYTHKSMQSINTNNI